MNNTNKNLMLNTLKGTSGIIDKVATIGPGSAGTIDLIASITWNAASDGVITNSANIDLENTGSSNLDVNAVGLFSSNGVVGSVVDTDTAITEAVSIYYFGVNITLQPGEILRLTNVSYTIE